MELAHLCHRLVESLKYELRGKKVGHGKIIYAGSDLWNESGCGSRQFRNFTGANDSVFMKPKLNGLVQFGRTLLIASRVPDGKVRGR
jgi:hypothetical protein